MIPYPTGERARHIYKGHGTKFYLKQNQTKDISNELIEKGINVISPSSEHDFRKWTLHIDSGEKAQALLEFCMEHQVGLTRFDKQRLLILSRNSSASHS